MNLTSQQNEQDIAKDLDKVMTEALYQLKRLTDADVLQEHHLPSIVKTFLLGVISTAIELVELNLPGSAPLLYADIEAGAKLGGLSAIKKWKLEHNSSYYSVSGIAPNDNVMGMNYLGQGLYAALIKGLNELPMPLRTDNMMLHSIQVLMANLLIMKFGNQGHQVLDSFCEHVHNAVTNIEKRKVKH